jgi:aspartyl-tRNA(Asn)/glutamyl-tRNA(Gln) amidotransferase subunit C
MKIGNDDVRHVARLAELALDDTEVPALAADLERIVAFVERLGGDADGELMPPLVIGPQRLELREDVINPVSLSIPPANMAPAFQENLFLVPKLGGLAEA